MSTYYSRQTIEKLIKKLDSKLKEDVEVIAIGGTALSLIGERLYSKDIDICYWKCNFPTDFAQNVVDAGKELGIRATDIEIFHGFEMSLLNISNFLERSIPYHKIHLNHIKLKVMNPVDITLSKIYRGEGKDMDDIRRLLNRGRISLSELSARFKEIVKSQDIDVRREFIAKYNKFIKGYTK